MAKWQFIFLQLKALLEPFGITCYYTDGWGAYERHVEPEKHTIGKENTQKTPSLNPLELEFRPDMAHTEALVCRYYLGGARYELEKAAGGHILAEIAIVARPDTILACIWRRSMPRSITIPDVDDATANWLLEEAERRGMSVEKVAALILLRGLEWERRQTELPTYHDLDTLAGTWTEDEGRAFLETIADFEQVDPGLWP